MSITGHSGQAMAWSSISHDMVIICLLISNQNYEVNKVKVHIGCQLQPVTRCHMSITTCSGQAMTRSSIMGDNVPPCIQLG